MGRTRWFYACICVYWLTVTAPGIILAPILIFSASIWLCVGLDECARGDFLMGDFLMGDVFFFVGFAVFLTTARGGVCGGEGSSSLSSSTADCEITGLFFGCRPFLFPWDEIGEVARGGVFFFWAGSSSVSTSSAAGRWNKNNYI